MRWQPELILKQLALAGHTVPTAPAIFAGTPHWEKFDRGMIGEEELAFALAHTTGVSSTTTLEFIKLVPAHLQPLQPGVNLLKRVNAQGYKTYVLSNMPSPALTCMMANHNFFDLFDGIVASCQIGAVKPEPEIYNHLLTAHKLKAEECLFIDDLSANIKAAHTLGIDGIVCDDHARVEKMLKGLGILK